MHAFTERYNKVSIPKLKESFSYASQYQIPKIEKVTINTGIGDALGNGQLINEIIELLTRVSGQKPVETKARKSVAGFKIRKGMVIGYKVTLRGDRMRDFLLKLSDYVLPRTRDFRGIKESSVTENGVLNIGMKDSSIFLESSHELPNQSIQIVVSSTATSKEEARLLFETIGFLFESRN